ncbi:MULTISPECIES: glycosyltransferase [Microbacterium]|uniref:glycosyltransferase n=1 Tax=Microbacterium TaxID=33882 RepID=UPI0006F4BCC3|nr:MULTISPECIES: glycosyltransferase [Microbacterium]KQR23434.1 hypothetical protein ASF76_09615 [Microbacterium sp. Leaf151]MCI9857106.1 hypothetical protein [Microbacterium proteolyticum]
MSMHVWGAGGKTAFICSTGGHLAELHRLEAVFGPHPDSLWITFDTPQSRQMLEGRRCAMLPYVGPRDVKGTMAAMRPLRRMLRGEPFDAAISTGAAIAAVALPIAAAHGIPATYIESVARLDGPSLTGRLLQRWPKVHLRTQNPTWADGRWKTSESVLSAYRGVPRTGHVKTDRLFVTLGTIRGYRFDSVIDAVLASGLANDDTVWQLGETPRGDLPGHVHDYLGPEEFTAAAAAADVVVSHAGVGSLLEMLALGIHPVLAVRSADRGEHVDNHQEQIASLVNDLGIATAVPGPAVTREICERAAALASVDDLIVERKRAV